MSVWRRKAIEAFPELGRELADSNEIFSVYALWFELRPLTVEAHREGKDDLLRRIYGYAEWCSRQRGELGNAVYVSFYEHLLDERWMRPLALSWLSAALVEEIRPLWEAQLSKDEMAEVDDLLERQPTR